MKKIAIIGVGYWGPNLIRNFLKFIEKDFIILCDNNLNRLKYISLEYDINNIETDYKKILENKDVDAVIICTPAKSHFQIAKDALLSGKHVLLEKPMTIKSEEAKELIEISENKNLILIVDLTYLYNSCVKKNKDIVSKENFGKIKYIDSTRINLGIFRNDVNVLWDLACHDISICNFILDKNPIFVRAIGKDYLKTGQIDTAYITLEYDYDIIANIHVSWLSPIKVRQMIFCGDKQSVIWDDIKIEDKIKIYNKNIIKQNNIIKCETGETLIPIVTNNEPLALLVKDFIDYIDNNNRDECFSNCKKSFNIIKILESANNSINNNGNTVYISY